MGGGYRKLLIQPPMQNRVETPALFKAENVLLGIRHEKEGKLRVTYTGWDARLSPFRARWLRGCSP